MIKTKSGNIGAVILAAGSSSRMGTPKQLLRFQNESLLRRAALAALDAGCSPVIVVTGANAGLLRVELEGLGVREVFNPQWESGMASSIRVGIEKLNDVDAAVLMVCDQPHVTADVIAALVEAYRTTRKPIVASSYGESFGVPALFERTLFNELMQLEGKAGAKKVIERYAAEAHFLPFTAGEVDVDTPDDFSRLTEASISNG